MSNIYLTKEEIEHPYADLKTMIEDKRRKAEQMSKTVFHQITVSPEILADKLVYDWGHLCHNGDIKIYWKSTILPDTVFGSKIEAFDATAAKLKEMRDDAC